MRRRASLGALAWPAVMLAAALALQWSGGGTLAAPPLSEPGRWGAWLQGRDPVVAAFSLLRLAGLGALWYLAGATALGVVLRLAGAVRLVAVADRVTVAPVRRILAGVTLGLAATTAAGIAGPVAMLPAAVASQAAPSTSTSTLPGGGAPDSVTMHLLAPAEAAPAAPAPAAASPASPVPPDGALQPAPPAAADQWTVRSGQCFWTVAESVLTQAWGRAPTDAEIVPYWQRLIAANRGVLAHAGDPDLIFPGQVFQIPAP